MRNVSCILHVPLSYNVANLGITTSLTVLYLVENGSATLGWSSRDNTSKHKKTILFQLRLKTYSPSIVGHMMTIYTWRDAKAAEQWGIGIFG